jgi:DNA-binding Lrp family transcriptional regulator
VADNIRSAFLADMRRLLGRDGRSDSRYGAIRFVSRGGPHTQAAVAAALNASAPATKELLERLRDDGFIEIDESGTRPRYTATLLARRIVSAVEGTAMAVVGGELLHHVIVCAARPRGRSDSELRAAMLESTLTLFSGYGSFQYVGICADEPDVVAALQGRVEALGSEALEFRASVIVERAPL